MLNDVDIATDHIDLLEEVKDNLDRCIELLLQSETDTENFLPLLVEVRQEANAEQQRCQKVLDEDAELNERLMIRDYERSLM